MPSVSEVFEELQGIHNAVAPLHTDNVNLTNTVKTGLDTINISIQKGVQSIDTTLNTGFVNLSNGIFAMTQLQQYTNSLLLYNNEQNNVIMCTLRQISQNICALLNEAHTQTEYQESMKETLHKLNRLYEFAHPDAQLNIRNIDEIEKKISKCCPEKKPEPICRLEPCLLDATIPVAPKISYFPLTNNEPK